jgi:hypothetical protein
MDRPSHGQDPARAECRIRAAGSQRVEHVQLIVRQRCAECGVRRRHAHFGGDEWVEAGAGVLGGEVESAAPLPTHALT